MRTACSSAVSTSGEAEPRQIVCGAWNFGAGATVAVALPGAVLPGGMKLERATLRGETSDGMILSERELELGQDHSGILVLDRRRAGDAARRRSPAARDRPRPRDHEQPGGPALGVRVRARRRNDASAWIWRLLPASDPEQVGDEPVGVEIEDLEGCPRYIGRLFRDVKVGPSPAWLRARLTAAGMRPISNVVDVTNYVMLGLGNPLHAFDFSDAGREPHRRPARPPRRESCARSTTSSASSTRPIS